MWWSEKEWNLMIFNGVAFLLIVGCLVGVGVSWVWRHVRASVSIQVKP